MYNNAFLNTTVRNNVFCARFYCALLSVPIGGHLQVKCTKIYIRVTTVYVNGSVESYIHSGHPNIYFVYILPEDGHRSGPKHVVSSAQ
jgi:hypothetical protein